jgi:acetylornithine deacetylase
MDVVTLATELVDLESITGNEAAIAVRLEEICNEMGLPVERQYVTESRWNILVNWKSASDVLLCTHLDTVPPFIPSSLDNEYLSGRGACDTKGIIAAMLVAGDRLIATGIRPSYLFVVGEETDSAGAKVAAATGRRARYVVVGEPTENTYAHAHKGVLSYTVSVSGIPGHSGYPDQGVSAIHVLLDLLHDLRSADWGSSEDVGKATVHVGLIEGGVAANVLAPYASCTIVHRVVDEVERRLKQVKLIVGDRADICVKTRNNPQRMHVPSGHTSIAVSFGTDVPYVREIGIPLLIGPGSIHDAHTKTEKISLAQLHAAVEIYHKLYRELIS